MDKKKLFARIFYSIGVFSGQLLLLINRINETNKHFSEFDKWIEKLKREERIELKKGLKK